MSISSGSNGGEDLVEREVELFVGFLIGHNGIGVGFGARPGGGGDRHHGERAGNRLAPAASGGGVIPQVAGIGGHSRHSYGRVEHGTASQREDEVAPVSFGAGGSLHHDLFRRVFVNVVTDDVSCAGFIQLGRHTVERAACLYGLTA